MENVNNDNLMKTSMAQVMPTELVMDLISALKPRTKDILVKRFGLEGGKCQTLEEIGRSHDITRERVRQIESAAIKDLQKGNHIKTIEPCEILLESVIGEYGGAMEHSHLVETFLDRVSPVKTHANVVDFVLNLSKKFEDHTNSNKINKTWTQTSGSIDIPQKIVDAAHEILKTSAKPIHEDQIVKKLLEHENARQHEVSNPKHVQSYLRLSNKLSKNPFAEWGFADWNEISPKGVKDKAHLVLKKNGKPLHFRGITEHINQTSFGGRKAIPQTVHNELIKDERFVLVGRGIYGLTEWGYSSGTVAEVVEQVLKSAEKPMDRDDVIAKVLEQRIVKRNTVALALQNTKRFKRVGKRSYTLAG